MVGGVTNILIWGNWTGPTGLETEQKELENALKNTNGFTQ